MDELYRYVCPDKVFFEINYVVQLSLLLYSLILKVFYIFSLKYQDLPSEEMGVGTREMGFLYGQYRRLAGHSQVRLRYLLLVGVIFFFILL